jgi:hypothetical protein
MSEDRANDDFSSERGFIATFSTFVFSPRITTDLPHLRLWMRLIEAALEFRAEALRAEAEGRKPFQGPAEARLDALSQLSAFARSFARGRPSEGRLRKRIGELSPAGRSFLDYGLARAAYAAGAAAVPRLEDLNLSEDTDRDVLRAAVEVGRGLLRDDPGPLGHHPEDVRQTSVCST